MNCKKCGAELPEGAAVCENCGTAAKKRGIEPLVILIIVAAVCLIILSVVAFFRFRGSSLEQHVAANQTVYSNGDIVYSPTEDHIAYDEDENVLYYNNLINVYTWTDLDEETANALADSVGGIIAGDISGAINYLQIVIKDSDYAHIMRMCDRLKDDENVYYASYDMPVTAEENSDPWGIGYSDSDLGNESSPGGNDWWAEAIGAYSAWEYEYLTTSIKVGILDSGFETNHEDLSGKISFLPDYPSNTVDDHGTHVAGLISANGDNNLGLRGVLQNAELICVDWSPVTNDYEDPDYTALIDTGEYLEVTKQLVESGVRIVNNSWGLNITYTAMDMLSGLTFEDTMAIYEEISQEASRQSMAMLIGLMHNGNRDFIIVQSAGNGAVNYLTLANEGVDAGLNGGYAAISKALFDAFGQDTWDDLEEEGITYESLQQRILIVGAVQNERNSKGQYVMTEFSNYGEMVDICAPGAYIFSTVTGNTYECLDGTSMSAPITAGVAALVWSINPELEADEVHNILINNYRYQASGTYDGTTWTYPMVDAKSAVEAAVASLSAGGYEAPETPAVEVPVEEPPMVEIPVTEEPDESPATEWPDFDFGSYLVDKMGLYGTWHVSQEITNHENREPLYDHFGSVDQEDYEMMLTTGDSFSFSIVTGNSGTGSYTVDGAMIYANFTDQSGNPDTLSMEVYYINGTDDYCLEMKVGDYSLFWVRNEYD